MRWAFLKQFPKFALVAAIIVFSTAAFFVWRATYGIRHIADSFNKQGVVEDIGPKVSQVETKHDRLLVVDNDLYEIETGALIFKRWLSEGMPVRLFYDEAQGKVIGQYPNGFVRYERSGKAEAKMLFPSGIGFSDDRRWAVWVRSGDVWRADIDWTQFKLVNERKVTSAESFHEQNFAGNVFVGTEKTLVVRNLPGLLRVNLETGEVKRAELSLLEIQKRRSPNQRWVAGLERGQFYCLDVDGEKANTVPFGRGSVTDYQWIGNDRCALLVNARQVSIYDREKNELKELCALPVPCRQVALPSSDGKWVFCIGQRSGVLVDLGHGRTIPLEGGAGLRWVGNDTFAFSRDVPDSNLRGTWLQKAGEEERRVAMEPYLVGRGGGMIMEMESAGAIIFATHHGISAMGRNGEEPKAVLTSAVMVSEIRGLEPWANAH